MNTCISDASFFYKEIGETLIGMCATYVDDTLQASNNEYSKLCDITEKKFNCKTRE